MTSMANPLPTDTTVMVAPTWSLMRRAASTAFSSKPLTTGGTPAAGATALVSGSILNAERGISGSITCLAQMMMFSANDGLQRHLATGPPTLRGRAGSRAAI